MAETIGSIQLAFDPNSLLLSHYSNPLNNPTKPFELITDSYFMERGSRYDAYAQLREAKLQSKRLNFEEDDQVLEIPKSEFSPLKKSVSFQDNFANEKVSEIPRYSPMKKSVSFQGNSKKQGISEEQQVSEIPRYSEFSPMKKSVRFQGNGKIQGIAEEKVSEIPRYSEFSPMKKNVRYQGNSKKQGYSVLAQSVPDFTSVIRKENQKPSENRIPRFEKSATPPPSAPKRDKMYGSGSKMGGGGSKSVNSGEKQSNGKLMMMGRKSYASIDELKGLSIAASNAINGENKGGKKGGNVLRKSTVFSSRYY